MKSFKYHPGFIEHRSDLTDDIGLVKMMKAANFRQNNIKPICLPFRRELQQIPVKLIAIGWGRTGNSKAGSAILQKATLPLHNLEGCRQKLLVKNRALKLVDGQFCAGGEGKFPAMLRDFETVKIFPISRTS